MKIAFDATTLRQERTGVGYYSERLFMHMVREEQDHDFFLLSNRPIETVDPLPANVRTRCGSGLSYTNLWMQLTAPRVLTDIRADVAHFTNSTIPLRKVVPTVLTVHDMTLTLFPGFHPFKRRLFRPLVAASIRAADAVVTVSTSAKMDILKLTKIPPERVFVIHEAASADFRPIEDRESLEIIRNKYKLAERILLTVGTIEPRKNLPRLIRAFARLKRRPGIPHQLVLVGSDGWGYEQVRREIETSGFAEDIVLTGYVPSEDLPFLYNLAEIFVFPSYYEGFGLPVVEAMACGRPVISSSESSLREVTAEASYAVDPSSESSIADALQTLIDRPALRDQLRECGLRRARRYSWSKAARKTFEVYRHVTRG